MSPNGVRWALSRCWRSVAVNVAGNRRHAAADAPAQVRNEGVVRLTIHELASQRRSRLSRRELTPLNQGGRTVLFEDVARVEVTVEAEVVVGLSLIHI